MRWGRTSVAWVVVALFGAIAASPSAHAAGPAVQAFNGRIGAGYQWTRIEEDGSFVGGTALESDTHQGFVTGTMTVPLSDSLGLRSSLLPNYGRMES